MSVPPLRLHNNFDSYISGEVTIHPSAVIAPGVILQAAANSKIIIGAGVCIGMGSILQVDEGTIEIEPSVSLGAGFLMVGAGKIGMNACIGAATTVFSCSIEAGAVVPPGSILGDVGRQIKVQEQEPTQQPTDNPATGTTQKPKEQENKVISSTSISAAFVEFHHQSTSVPESSTVPETQSATVEEEQPDSTQTQLSPEDSVSDETATASSNSFGTQIYGQGSIQRLLVTLFPHRQSLNNPVSDDSSE